MSLYPAINRGLIILQFQQKYKGILIYIISAPKFAVLYKVIISIWIAWFIRDTVHLSVFLNIFISSLKKS